MNKKSIIIKTSSEKETQELAKAFSTLLKGGEIIGLRGGLGSGKTVFVKGLAKGFGIKKKITSPTFVIVKSYQFGKKEQFLYHFDLYRLKAVRELEELGFSEIINSKKDIIALEWPERASRLLPKGTIFISLAHGGGSTERVIKISQ